MCRIVEGEHNNQRKSYGRACIIDPWGKIGKLYQNENDLCVCCGSATRVKQSMASLASLI